MSIINQIKEVLSTEQEALSDLQNNIDSSFEKAIQLLSQTQCTVFVSGIGKSYHIAAKIASTFASTGTRAFCLHPSEAQHGDLGMLLPQDIVILLSKSGQSEEILQLIPVLHKMNCSIIAFVCVKDSKLAQLADIVLHIPIKKEACFLNLAPTSSTTAMLALGDALAVVLMRKRNFTKEEFALRHPAGLLGKQLLYTVDDIMQKGEANPVISLTTPFEIVLDSIMQYKMNALSVIDDQGCFQGIVTSYDIRKVLQQHLETCENLKKQTASLIMNTQACYIESGMLAIECFQAMKDKILPKTIPVLLKNKPIGMISIDTLLQVGF